MDLTSDKRTYLSTTGKLHQRVFGLSGGMLPTDCPADGGSLIARVNATEARRYTGEDRCSVCFPGSAPRTTETEE